MAACHLTITGKDDASIVDSWGNDQRIRIIPNALRFPKKKDFVDGLLTLIYGKFFPAALLAKLTYQRRWWNLLGILQSIRIYIARRYHEVIGKDRGCEAWCPYKQFLDPKTHYEELQMQQLEQSRKDFELRMEEDRRKWNDRIAQSEERNQTRSNRITLWLVILSVAQVITAVAAVIIAVVR